MARFIRDEINGRKDNWREGNGRPKESGTKAQQVFEYRAAHPDAKKIDCERETKLSRHTVLKWWNWQPEHEKTVDEMTDEEYEQLFYHEMDMDIMFDIRQNGRWSESDEEELTAFKANRKALVSPLKRIEMRDHGFKVSQEAEYDAMIEELEREIEKNYLEWSEKGDAMRGE